MWAKHGGPLLDAMGGRFQSVKLFYKVGDKHAFNEITIFWPAHYCVYASVCTRQVQENSAGIIWIPEWNSTLQFSPLLATFFM